MADQEPPLVPNGKWAFYAWVIRTLYHSLGVVGIVALVAVFLMAGGKLPILQSHQVDMSDTTVRLDPHTTEEFRAYHAKLADSMARLNQVVSDIQEGQRDMQRTALRQSITLENLAQLQSKTDLVVTEIWRWERERERKEGRDE